MTLWQSFHKTINTILMYFKRDKEYKLSYEVKFCYLTIKGFKAYKECKALNPDIPFLDKYLEGFIYSYLISAGKYYKHDEMIKALKEAMDKQKIKYCEKLDLTRYVKMAKALMPPPISRMLDNLSIEGDNRYAYARDFSNMNVFSFEIRLKDKSLYEFIEYGNQ